MGGSAGDSDHRARLSLMGLRPCLFLICLLCSNPALAVDPIYPLEVINNNPLFALYGIPRSGSPQLLQQGQQQFSLTSEVSSYYAIEKTANEKIELDGEVYTTVFTWLYGISRQLQVGLEIPYIRHTGGTLDGFINEWHEFFDLAEGGRNFVPNDRFLFYYERFGQVLLDYQQPERGIGDISVNAAWQGGQDRDDYWAIKFNLNLPSGDSSGYHGNGYTDTAVWLQNRRSGEFYAMRAAIFYSLGLLYIENSDIFPQFINRKVGFGNLGAGVHLTPDTVFISQLDFHTPIYSGPQVNDLSGYAVQLSLGGRINVPGGRLHISVGEDLVLDVSPDITFHLRYEWTR